MTEIIESLRKIPAFAAAIIPSVTLYKESRRVEADVICDKHYSDDERAAAERVVRSFVPDYFSCGVRISKLTPDEEMVAKKIFAIINEGDRRLASFVTPSDVTVERTRDGFYFTVKVVGASLYKNAEDNIIRALSKCYCGGFGGRIVESETSIDEVEIEETKENIEYEIPIRTFKIEGFEFLEGTVTQTTAVYLADLNFVSENVVVCGRILDIRERTITTSSGREKLMLSFTVGDGTATMRISYFTRQKSIDKIKKLQSGDWVVMTCKTDLFRGEVRATANFIDLGRVPEDFVPEKRASKPVPKYYKTVSPKPFVDFTQDTLFTDNTLPSCLTENTFVVFDLETTGLNSSPSSGNMDRIIEIGAYKIIGGEIKESFTTFVNPQRRLSEEIINLTGIDQATVDAAPVYEKVIPDFFKFISGAYLVGHNMANFDYKFIDYYCAQCGYMTERKIFDTIPLSQKLLHLPNYKLNTVAAHFGITFNHHRASDDALVTAKIFIELIKLKKSLPDPS